MMSHCGFICLFLMLSDGENLFMYLLGFCVFFGKMSIWVLCPFLNWITCCLTFELYEFLMYFGYIGSFIFTIIWVNIIDFVSFRILEYYAIIIKNLFLNTLNNLIWHLPKELRNMMKNLLPVPVLLSICVFIASTEAFILS